MTTLPQQDTIKQYIGNGVIDEFVVPFYTPISTINNSPAIDVYVTPLGQTPIPADDILIWPTDFTYDPNPEPTTGGTITFEPASIPPLGSTVTFSRNVPDELTVEFADAQNFSGQNLDDVLLSLLIMIQQNNTYATQRNLSYRVNSYLPTSDIILANTQLPLLEPNQIWMGQGDGVIATTLEENPDSSTLRTDLANESPGTAGATIVGYYNTAQTTAQTVQEGLDGAYTSTSDLSDELASQVNGDDGALLVGYRDTIHLTGKTVHAALLELQNALINGYQKVSSISSASLSSTATYSLNTSAPTQTDGHLYYSVAITPKSATSILKITAFANFKPSVASNPGFWIAQDAVANAIKSVTVPGALNVNDYVEFVYYMTSGTTSATTFKLYAGLNTPGTLELNQVFGAAGISGIVVEEINTYA